MLSTSTCVERNTKTGFLVKRLFSTGPTSTTSASKSNAIFTIMSPRTTKTSSTQGNKLNEPRDKKSKRKAMNRNWCNQKANPALNIKAGNK